MKYEHGDLLSMAEAGRFDIIVHGCNCFNTMGSGIAAIIADRYPKVRLIDQATEKGDPEKMGKITKAHVWAPNKRSTGFTVINAYTQFRYGPGGPHLDYHAVRDCFKQIKLLFDTDTAASCRIGIPQIGAGLGGGSWPLIEKIIDEIGFSDLTCVKFKGGV